jgi:hypothetical protein
MKKRCSRPKGEQIVAQGFSPGKRGKLDSPCRGGRICLALLNRTLRLPTAYIGRPFRANRELGFPRAKALGCSLCPFRACPTGVSVGGQYSRTPLFHHSAWLGSRTACPTKPDSYIADGSSWPRKQGALHKKDVGEVGRTRTKPLVRTCTL